MGPVTGRRRAATPTMRRVIDAVRTGGVGVIVIVLLWLMWLGLKVSNTAGTVELEERATTQERQLRAVADPLARLCATNEAARAVAGDDACQTAEEVVQVPGPQGEPGKDGRGVVSTTINPDGHLLVTYTDGRQDDVGRVVGRDGTRGAPGRGITAANITSGRLVLVYSDGTTQDLGPIVGERGADGLDGPRGPKGDPGRGIASTEIVDGRLVITYTDGATEDAGPVPAGPAGPAGPQGPAGEPAKLPSSFTEYYPDGTSRTCTRRVDDTDDASPTYDCTSPAPEGEDD